MSRRIIVPLGRTRAEVEATLRRAARELHEETNADAIGIYAYRPQDDPSGQYSVGRAILAPNGDWSEAGSSGPMRTTVDLNELYFRPAVERVKAGDTVELISRRGEPIEISNDYGAWYEEHIVARVQPGTHAVVLERRSEPMGDQEFVRYRIRTEGSPRAEGWVHGSNVENE